MNKDEASNPPLITFDKEGKASVLDYNLPTTTSYYGHGMYDLEIPKEWFTEIAFEKPEILVGSGGTTTVIGNGHWPPDLRGELKARADVLSKVDTGNPNLHTVLSDAATAADVLGEAAKVGGKLFGKLNGEFKSKYGKLLGKEWESFTTDYQQKVDQYLVANDIQNSQYWTPVYDKMGILKSENVEPKPRLGLNSQAIAPNTSNGNQALAASPQFTSQEIVELANQGKRIVPYRRQSGAIDALVVAQPKNRDDVHPKLLLVEHYRLTSFLGNYGAGQTLNTYTLFPGEETTFSIKTWKQKSETIKESASVLDSYDEKNANDYQAELHTENSNQQKVDEMNSWGVSASASASWFFGSASINADAKGSLNESREYAAKATNNALNKKTSEANRKRQTQVDTSKQVTTEEGQETQITRSIKNVNLSRVMNFVFRQLNQEYITYLHLTDVHIAFTNGYFDCMREVGLSELATFLKKYIKEEHHKKIHDAVREKYQNVKSWKDLPAELIEEVEEVIDDKVYKYRRTKQGHISPKNIKTGVEEEENLDHRRFLNNVPGIILSKHINILLTDAVIVDALLGQGVALDDYALDSQNETLRGKRAANSLSEAETEKLQLAMKIIKEKDTDQAALYQQLFPPITNKEEEKKEKGDA